MKNIYIVNEMGNGLSHSHKIYSLSESLTKKGYQVILLLGKPIEFKKYLDLKKIDIENSFVNKLLIVDMSTNLKKSTKEFSYETNYANVLLKSTDFTKDRVTHYFKKYYFMFSKYPPEHIYCDISFYMQLYCYHHKMMDRMSKITSNIFEFNINESDYYNSYFFGNNVFTISSKESESERNLRQIIKKESGLLIPNLKSIVNTDKIIFTGFVNPKSSYVYINDNIIKSRQKYHKKTASKKIVYLYMLGIQDKVLPRLLEILSNNNELTVYANIKDLHTIDTDKYKNIHFLSGFVNQIDYINQSDLCIFSGENSVYESLLLNKPTLIACRHNMLFGGYLVLKNHLKIENLSLISLHNSNDEISHSINNMLNTNVTELNVTGNNIISKYDDFDRVL